mmetsp:Transcript_91182/g.181823  ORF Transcript_91182/g.181823 Transcript_91182/m.181823 type:complete len:272 (+) Transcript_91182:84-899(+)|eukprot:CAMPEP_0171633890 /NCGR_PEP_ID=MMETSP0990-20121206/25527_1 /TAXON_ID=483369 /ORGANISM="non described non described, Strain CCMP2098" /LENGTH=271 /DNA_ID=CAMNT_0012204803 /DNA_START=45 /DNA_END=860 /DNA_ORIENTATION=+
MALISSTAVKAVVIFCHGSGDTATGAQAWVEEVAPAKMMERLQSQGVVFEYPSATPRPYSLWAGEISSIWFDRTGGLEPHHPEHEQSVESSATALNSLIDEVCCKYAVAPSQVAFGGFSMGGGIALQTVSRCSHRLGAAFALSSYLNDDSRVFVRMEKNAIVAGAGASAAGRGIVDGASADQVTALNAATKTTKLTASTPFLSGAVPLFMAHGMHDRMIGFQWGQRTASRLSSGGVPVNFFPMPGVDHDLTGPEFEALFKFLSKPLGIDFE